MCGLINTFRWQNTLRLSTRFEMVSHLELGIRTGGVMAGLSMAVILHFWGSGLPIHTKLPPASQIKNTTHGIQDTSPIQNR